jgi:tRNA threonylcarbamoyladenosine biosynthesis protein TsaE
MDSHAPAPLTVVAGDALETQRIGIALAAGLVGGDVVSLIGDLGAGKTTFTQGVARGLGITRPVTSPTFTLVNRYRTAGGTYLQHVDCYRLADAPREMWDMGLFDLLAGEDIVLIEWADRIAGLLPDDMLEIRFEYVTDDSRRLTFEGHGARGEVLCTLIRAFLAGPSRYS